MKAGIAVDDYKLDVFKEHLDKSGFSYTLAPLEGFKDLTMIEVEMQLADHDRLKVLCETANQEAGGKRAVEEFVNPDKLN